MGRLGWLSGIHAHAYNAHACTDMIFAHASISMRTALTWGLSSVFGLLAIFKGFYRGYKYTFYFGLVLWSSFLLLKDKDNIRFSRQRLRGGIKQFPHTYLKLYSRSSLACSPLLRAKADYPLNRFFVLIHTPFFRLSGPSIYPLSLSPG